jgi:hypothetical protein
MMMLTSSLPFVFVCLFLVVCSRFDLSLAKEKAKPAAGGGGGGLFAHERAMAEAKGILAMLGVKNPTAAQLKDMTETVKTTGLTLADLQQAQVSDR